VFARGRDVFERHLVSENREWRRNIVTTAQKPHGPRTHIEVLEPRTNKYEIQVITRSFYD